MNNAFELTAATLDSEPARVRGYTIRLGATRERAYGDWREMPEGEHKRPNRLDLITVARPESSHFEIASAFLGLASTCSVKHP